MVRQSVGYLRPMPPGASRGQVGGARCISVDVDRWRSSDAWQPPQRHWTPTFRNDNLAPEQSMGTHKRVRIPNVGAVQLWPRPVHFRSLRLTLELVMRICVDDRLCYFRLAPLMIMSKFGLPMANRRQGQRCVCRRGDGAIRLCTVGYIMPVSLVGLILSRATRSLTTAKTQACG